MKILVDADACPVVPAVERIAAEAGIPVMLFCDTNHILVSGYSEIKVIGAGRDAVDFALLKECNRGDIVVTQDYGLAAMILGKGAYGIHQNGLRYTDANIDGLLMDRHMAKKARQSKQRRHGKGPARRTPEDDRQFEEALKKLLCTKG